MLKSYSFLDSLDNLTSQFELKKDMYLLKMTEYKIMESTHTSRTRLDIMNEELEKEKGVLEELIRHSRILSDKMKMMDSLANDVKTDSTNFLCFRPIFKI